MVIDGKRRNLKNRTKCLSCLPFKFKPAHDKNRIKMKNKLKFRRYYYNKKKELGINPVLYRRQKRKLAIISLVDSKCQICGYGRLLQNITFHHIDQDEKSINLSLNEFKLDFSKMKDEFMKCIVVCHLCHNEIHYADFHSHEKIISLNEIFKSKIINLTDWPETTKPSSC